MHIISAFNSGIYVAHLNHLVLLVVQHVAAECKILINLLVADLRVDLTVILHLRAYALWGCSRFLMRMIVLYAVVSVSILML